jgi:hypothetical protein
LVVLADLRGSSALWPQSSLPVRPSVMAHALAVTGGGALKSSRPCLVSGRVAQPDARAKVKAQRLKVKGRFERQIPSRGPGAEVLIEVFMLELPLSFSH